MPWGVIDDEAIAAARELIGVELRRERMQWVESATKDAIKHFAWGVGDNNPLWLDEKYAKETRWGTIIAPPTFLYAIDMTTVAPKLPGVQWIYAGTGWTFYDVVRREDTFKVLARLIEVQEKTGAFAARWALQIGEILYRSQTGALVARALGKCARTPRGDQLKKEGKQKYEARGPHKYTPDEIADIERQILAEERRGSEPRYWEDVEIDAEISPVVKGPLTGTDIVAWYSATQGAQPYGGAHGDVIRYRRRHQDYHVNKETGTRDSAGRGHLEASTGVDVGMGGAYDVGPQRISWGVHMLTNWMGDDGFLHKVDVDVRRPNLVGDTTWWRGKVSGKRIVGNVHFVDLEVWASNQRNEITAPGTAVVALPSREHGPVPLPIAAE
ncbi:MAG: MaoC family dehydratase N-terminal domain-containing protein [Chloroflexi bacterium]|nr:MaoC family dehydratase N-terminal domain-containing protein [Chloroflexota bacterium]